MPVKSLQGAATGSPLPLGERGRVRGTTRGSARRIIAAVDMRRQYAADSGAPAGAKPLTLSLSPKGRGDSTGAPGVEAREPC
jgi:hypothetical protein